MPLFIFVLAVCVFGSGECFSDVVAEVNQSVESFQKYVVGFRSFPVLGCVCVQLKENSMGGSGGTYGIFVSECSFSLQKGEVSSNHRTRLRG